MKDIEIVRKSITTITKILSGRGVEVTQIGSEAFVRSNMITGEVVSINIPYIPDDASEELIYAINGFLDHEVAHVLFTNFKMAREIESPKLLKAIYNVLEDMRIEELMGNKFPGSKTNLLNVGRFVIDKKINILYEEMMNQGETEEIRFFECLFAPFFRSYGQDVFAEYMNDKWDKVQTIKNKLVPVEEEIGKSNSTEDVVKLAKKILAILEDKKEEEKDNEPNSKDGEEDSDNDEGDSDNKQDGSRKNQPKENSDGENSSSKPEDDNDVGAEDDSSSPEQELEDNESGNRGEDKQDDEQGDESNGESEDSNRESQQKNNSNNDSDSESENGESEQTDRFELSDLNPKDLSESIAEAIESDVVLALQNSDYRVLTKDYDLIEKVNYEKEIENILGISGLSKSRKKVYLEGAERAKLEKEIDETLSLIEDESRKISGVLQKTLERLVKAKTRTRNLPGKRCGRVNPSSLFRLKTGDDRVFRQRDIGESKDVAISLVIDCSGSMMGNKIRLAIEAAFSLCDVLSKIGIKNEVIGFTTLEMTREMLEEIERFYAKCDGVARSFSRTEPLWLPIFKSFDERFLTQNKRNMTLAAIGSLRLRNNIDGESITLAAKRLMAQKEKGKQMIVLSDGAPVGWGCRDDIESDLLRSVKEAESMGIKVLGVGIMDNSVEGFYTNNMVINELNELPIAILEKIKDILV